MAGKLSKSTEDSSCKSDSTVNKLQMTIMSFGYKQGAPPPAAMIFDVRFLKNPFWVPELRPLTGLDHRVQEYVLEQELAAEFIETLLNLVTSVAPNFAKLDILKFSLALGCTGGQHRSVALAEALANRLKLTFPDCQISTFHRELSGMPESSLGSDCKQAEQSAAVSYKEDL